MFLAARRAAPVAALIACALAAPAAHAAGGDDRLVAQIAEAAPTPSPTREPTLTGRPPVRLASATVTPAAASTAAGAAASEARPTLPATGAEAALLALAGAGLLGSGFGLRLALRDGSTR
jgi:hypothetical protein